MGTILSVNFSAFTARVSQDGPNASELCRNGRRRKREFAFGLHQLNSGRCFDWHQEDGIFYRSRLNNPRRDHPVPFDQRRLPGLLVNLKKENDRANGNHHIIDDRGRPRRDVISKWKYASLRALQIRSADEFDWRFVVYISRPAAGAHRFAVVGMRNSTARLRCRLPHY